MTLQTIKAQAFKALHERAGIFVIPNPWDAGSAKILAALGYEALATTSAGLAFSLGKPDADVQRQEALENARAVVSATSLPVSADLQDGFGEDPETCAETILLAAQRRPGPAPPAAGAGPRGTRARRPGDRRANPWPRRLVGNSR